ncbi:MAG: site-specific integrase, partial [Atopobiaceae bacterium]|nr:site-specific integrase [Atopobiaceae bacterium]
MGGEAKSRSASQERFRSQVADFIRYLSSVRNLSPNTVRAYESDLDAYASWAEREGIDPLEVSHRDLRFFLADLSRARYTTRTINRHLSAVRALYRWLLHEGLTERDAAAAVASPKLAKTLPKTISDADVARLLE